MSRFLNTQLGAALQQTNRAILVRVNNTAQLARSQGGIATAAQRIAPATVEARVYDEVAKSLRQAFKDQNVDADVELVEPSGWSPATASFVWSDIAAGVGLIGVTALLWRYISKRRAG